MLMGMCTHYMIDKQDNNITVYLRFRYVDKDSPNSIYYLYDKENNSTNLLYDGVLKSIFYAALLGTCRNKDSVFEDGVHRFNNNNIHSLPKFLTEDHIFTIGYSNSWNNVLKSSVDIIRPIKFGDVSIEDYTYRGFKQSIELYQSIISLDSKRYSFFEYDLGDINFFNGFDLFFNISDLGDINLDDQKGNEVIKIIS